MAAVDIRTRALNRSKLMLLFDNDLEAVRTFENLVLDVTMNLAGATNTNTDDIGAMSTAVQDASTRSAIALAEAMRPVDAAALALGIAPFLPRAFPGAVPANDASTILMHKALGR